MKKLIAGIVIAIAALVYYQTSVADDLEIANNVSSSMFGSMAISMDRGAQDEIANIKMQRNICWGVGAVGVLIAAWGGVSLATRNKLKS